MPLGTKIGLGPGNVVLDGGPSCLLKMGTAPPLFPHVYCSQTARWTKMPLGTMVDLGPGHIVLDGDPAPPPSPKGHSPPIFGPCLLWPNGWMDQDATWYGGRPQSRRHCVRRETQLALKRGTAPTF